jgi:hypothetical protein
MVEGLSNLDRQQERKCGQRESSAQPSDIDVTRLSFWATRQVGWSDLVGSGFALFGEACVRTRGRYGQPISNLAKRL